MSRASWVVDVRFLALDTDASPTRPLDMLGVRGYDIRERDRLLYQQYSRRKKKSARVGALM
ncbi:MAG: hypothetical protein AAF658_20450, partial [Myxococcota bacterium]